MLAEYGAFIVDADVIARNLQQAGSEVVEQIAARFGDQVLSADGSLDRAALAALVFGDSNDQQQGLSDLNQIMRPPIRAEIDHQISVHADTDHVVVLDFPLLGENPRSDLSAMVVVDAPIDIVVQRLAESRGMTEKDALARIASQMSREDRVSKADRVIDNSGDRHALDLGTNELWQWIASLPQL